MSQIVFCICWCYYILSNSYSLFKPFLVQAYLWFPKSLCFKCLSWVLFYHFKCFKHQQLKPLLGNYMTFNIITLLVEVTGTCQI